MNKNDNNYLFENSKKSFKERRLLKIKLKKLSNKYIKSNCDKHLMKMRDLNIDLLNNKNEINNIIKQSINFHFGNNNNNNSINNNIDQIQNTINNLSEFDLNCKNFCKTLKLELSSNELKAIKNDKLYYFPNEKIRNNLKLFKDRSLYELINEERNKKIKFSLSNKKIKDKFQYDNSYYNLKNTIKQRNSEIKNGILKIKQEEMKNKLIKEKRKNIVLELQKEAFKEVNNNKFKNPIFNLIVKIEKIL